MTNLSCLIAWVWRPMCRYKPMSVLLFISKQPGHLTWWGQERYFLQHFPHSKASNHRWLGDRKCLGLFMTYGIFINPRINRLLSHVLFPHQQEATTPRDFEHSLLSLGPCILLNVTINNINSSQTRLGCFMPYINNSLSHKHYSCESSKHTSWTRQGYIKLLQGEHKEEKKISLHIKPYIETLKTIHRDSSLLRYNFQSRRKKI